MRPAKFLLALLFGAAVLVTFLKLLMFALIATAVVGGVWTVVRAVRFLAFSGGQNDWPTRPNDWPNGWQNDHRSAPPISLGGGFRGPSNAPFGQRIEVF